MSSTEHSAKVLLIVTKTHPSTSLSSRMADDEEVFFENSAEPTESAPNTSPPPLTSGNHQKNRSLTNIPPQTSDRIKTNLQLLDECDNFPYQATNPDSYAAHITTYYHLILPDQSRSLGLLLPSVASVFQGLPAWEVDDENKTLTLTAGNDRATRSAAVAATTAAMRATGHFEVLNGWRDELYPVYGEDGQIVFEIERAASSLFGVVTYGVHMTAYQRVRAGVQETLKIWVPRRAKDKSTYPSMLDNTVAGGIGVGEGPFESLIRESAEEASLSEAFVRENVRSTGAVTYFHIRDERAGGETRLLQPECQYTYDLEVGEDIEPRPSDDEVEGFTLMGVEEVKEMLAAGEFKPNCALVLLDFFIRHGVLTYENERDYIEIVARLHRLLELPTARF